MANTSLLPPEQWQEVRRAAEAGITLEEVAEKYGIPFRTVQKRSQREEWLTTAKLAKRAKEIQEAKSHKVSKGAKEHVSALETVALSLAERGEQCRSRLLDLARKGVEKAHKADLPVTSWQDAKIIAEIASKALGDDKSQVGVQVLFQSAESVPVYEDGEVIELEQESEGEGLIEV